jgi:predicted HAD superfamily phosphohydrolase YqeG
MNKLNTEEIKHIRDLALADLINGNDKTINGSILRKLDEQLIIADVSDTLISWEQFKKENWYESETIDVEKLLIHQFQEIYGR